MNLSKEELGPIIVRILGVYSLLIALSQFTTVLQLMVYSQMGMEDFSFLGFLRSLAAVLPLVLVGFWFLFSAGTLGVRLVGTGPKRKRIPSHGAKQWQAIAFSVLGLYVILTNIPRLISVAAMVASDAPKGSRLTVEILGTLAILAAGLWLVLSAKGVVALIQRARTVGPVDR